MANETDMREMILAFGGALARRCVDAVTAGGLTNGRLVDAAEVGGVHWTFEAIYSHEIEVVTILAQPVRAPTNMGEVFAQMFGLDTDTPNFTLAVPVAWLPE